MEKNSFLKSLKKSFFAIINFLVVIGKFVLKSLRKLLPENLKDIYFYLLLFVVFSPIITCLVEELHFLWFNWLMLIIIFFDSLIYIFAKQKYKDIKISTGTALLLIFGFILVVITPFSTDILTTFTNHLNSFLTEGIFQYLYYVAVALCAICADKKNLKYLVNCLIICACIMIAWQFKRNYLWWGFGNINHTGYFLVTTFTLSAGFFVVSKSKIGNLFYAYSTILHSVSLCKNGSLGPVVGILAFLVCGLIFCLIKKREFALKLIIVAEIFCLTFFIYEYCIYSKCILILFVSVVSLLYLILSLIFSNDKIVLEKKKINCLVIIIMLIIFASTTVFGIKFSSQTQTTNGEATTIVQLIDVAKVVLNKIGIISNETMQAEQISAGADGYGRLKMWKRAIENIKERPFVGVGIGVWWIFNPSMPSVKPHNEFLQYGAEGGIFLLACYISILIYIFIKYLKKSKTASNEAFVYVSAVFAYVVQSVFGNVMCCSAPFFYLVIGLAIKELDYNKTKEETNENDKIEIIKMDKNSENQNDGVANKQVDKISEDTKDKTTNK